jgi:hypothetical protein
MEVRFPVEGTSWALQVTVVGMLSLKTRKKRLQSFVILCESVIYQQMKKDIYCLERFQGYRTPPFNNLIP